MKEVQRVVALDAYEEGAVITALNDMRNKQLAERKPTDVVDEVLLKVLRSPAKKVRAGSLRSLAETSWGKEEQRSEADARQKAGVAERSLRRRDAAR